MNDECRSRSPQLGGDLSVIGPDLCEEVQQRTRLGPLVPPPLPQKKNKKNKNPSSIGSATVEDGKAKKVVHAAQHRTNVIQLD
jgi:hypothetical protein